MSRGTARGIASGFLGLIALQAVATQGGSGRVAEFFRDVSAVVERVLDPDVPAIPDRRTGAGQNGGKTKQEIKDEKPQPRLPVPAPPKPPKQKD